MNRKRNQGVSGWRWDIMDQSNAGVKTKRKKPIIIIIIIGSHKLRKGNEQRGRPPHNVRDSAIESRGYYISCLFFSFFLLHLSRSTRLMEINIKFSFFFVGSEKKNGRTKARAPVRNWVRPPEPDIGPSPYSFYYFGYFVLFISSFWIWKPTHPPSSISTLFNTTQDETGFSHRGLFHTSA